MEEQTGQSTEVAGEFSVWIEQIQKVLIGDFTPLEQFGNFAIIPAIKALAILAAFYFLATYASRLMSGPIQSRVDKTLGRFLEKLIYRGLIGCGFVFVLHSFGVRSTSFAAIIAAMGFAIGLAFQGTLSNFASGVLLMVFRPFKVGDLVVTDGVTAIVREIDLFCTMVDTPDNRRLIIPNSAIAGHTIENITHHPVRRLEIPVGIAYSADLNQTREALMAATAGCADSIIQNEERKSQALLMGFGASAIDWQVRVWVATADFNRVRDLMIASIKHQLDLAEIPIAFPQLDVHLDPAARAAMLGGGHRTLPRRISPTSDAA